MWIDPQLKPLLDQLAAAGGPHPTEIGLAGVREGFSQLWRMTNAPARPSVRSEEVSIPGAAGNLRAKVYRPQGASGALPVLAYFHGGGCCMMSPEDFEGTSTALAEEANCLVVVPAYRRAPENPFPAPMEDCTAVFAWLQKNAGTIGGDPSRIAVAGDSGGGYLAAAVSQEAKRRGLKQPVLQLLIYPMTDMAGLAQSRIEESLFLDDRTLQWVIDMHCGKSRTDPRASPLLEPDVSGLAPAVVIAAQIDPLRDEGRAYTAKLRGAGVPVAYHMYEGVVHGFFNFGGFLDQANAAMSQSAAHLRAAFAKKS